MDIKNKKITTKKVVNKTTTKNKGGQTKYSDDLFNKICDELAQSSTALYKICQNNGITRATFMNWVNNNKDLFAIYDNAKEEQLKFLAEQIIDIADNGSGDTNRDKLRIESRKWLLSKLDRKKFGDQITQDINVKNEAPLFIIKD